MAERAYLSIGEVLSLLRAEFPDVTISKIRFLESQGLLDPERTPSGYRKFYPADVDRLRWILRQQRENFLPLKVIKGRLLGDEAEAALGAEGAAVLPGRAAAVEVPAIEDPAIETPAVETPPAIETPAVETPPAIEVPAVEAPAVEAPAARPPAAEAAADEAPVPGAVSPPRRPEPPLASTGLSAASLTLEELASASGLSPDGVRDLERAGFITGRSMADTMYYDEECVTVARLVAGFARFGIEPRHLRIYKNSAERESGLFQQVIVPLLKQRNPDARRKAVDALEELSELGERLRAAMLRQALKGLTGG